MADNEENPIAIVAPERAGNKGAGQYAKGGGNRRPTTLKPATPPPAQRTKNKGGKRS